MKLTAAQKAAARRKLLGGDATLPITDQVEGQNSVCEGATVSGAVAFAKGKPVSKGKPAPVATAGRYDGMSKATLDNLALAKMNRVKATLADLAKSLRK